MKRIFSGILFIWILTGSLSAQQKDWIKGSVSFASAANVYVRFENTTDIKEGDTLYIDEAGLFKAALVVKKKSSLSCVTEPLITGKAWTTGMVVMSKSVGEKGRSKWRTGKPDPGSSNRRHCQYRNS